MISILFLVNGDVGSAAAIRAESFAARLGDGFRTSIAYRSGSKVRSIARFVARLREFDPDIVYVVDMAYSGVIAAALYRVLHRCRVVVDTGDAITALARSVGERGRLGLALTAALERFSIWLADTIVVRGSEHERVLNGVDARVVVVQDGVETSTFHASDAAELRRDLGLDDVLTVGLVGSSVWSERLGICYGWELVEALALVKDAPVKGVLIGGGSGIERLKKRCAQYGIDERIVFIDFVPYADLARYLSLVDVCLSTQTNDVVGQVRTTGKLPLYLATGRFVLASRVGEAALVLDEEMLVPYDGVVDRNYPGRLAERILRLANDRSLLRAGDRNVSIARERFDYDVLASRLRRALVETAAA